MLLEQRNERPVNHVAASQPDDSREFIFLERRKVGILSDHDESMLDGISNDPPIIVATRTEVENMNGFMTLRSEP